MRFFDALFGRTRLKRPKTEGLFTLVTAQVDLELNLHWVPGDKAALCLKPVTTAEFGAAQSEFEELVRLAASDSGTDLRVEVDPFRYRWLIFTDADFEDLVGVIHIAGGELQDKGYGEQLLAAVFRFSEFESGLCYLIYSYKRGAFYPFIPLPGKNRDNAAELRAATLLESFLPCEKDHSRWYPLWDCPV